MKINVILAFIVGINLLGCSTSPRYHHTKKTESSRGYKKDTLLTKGVKHTAIMTASYYGEGDVFHGRRTSNGEIFDKNGITAAHKTLPFGTVLKVTFPKTGKSVKVRINDRGPFIAGRDLDLSYGAAKKIGLVGQGVGKVNVTVIKWGSGR